MSDPTKVSYGYDPVAKAGLDRWGKKGEDRHTAPDIPNYEFFDVLGSGAMGVVWSARYRPLNQSRAVKVLSKAMAMDAKFLERFAEEAKVLARLEHPNLVKVFDASADPECPYIAMDFVPGKPLSDILKTRGLTRDEALKYFGQIAQALDYAHGSGFIHRDVKPSNIMITNAGNAMLIDFGVASWLGGGSEKNVVIGTARYLSPEACKGERVTKAADLWAFAVSLYRSLSGAFPFDGKNEQEITRAIVNMPAKEPPHVSGRVRRFLLRILDKNPKERPQTAQAVVDEYRRASTIISIGKHREPLALGTSMALFGLAVVSLVGGTVWLVGRYSAPKKVVVYKVVNPKGGSTDLPSVSNPVAAVSTISYLKGVWYADFGNQWAEIHVTSTSGRKFQAEISERDQSGSTTSEAAGEILSGNRIRYDEVKADGSAVGSFVGSISDDRSKITGKRTDPSGTSSDGSWVRAAGIASTLYTNADLQFSVPAPAGWQANAGDVPTLSPIGRTDVVFAVKVAPITDGETIQDVFQVREKELTDAAASGGSYENLGSNPSATLGGQPALSWNLRDQSQGDPSTRDAVIVGLIRGQTSFTVECWWPSNEQDVWGPILESMRSRLAFSG